MELDSSLCFIGPKGSGKRTLLGKMSYEIGLCPERELSRAKQNDPVEYWSRVWSSGYGDASTTRYKQLLFASGLFTTVYDGRGGVRNVLLNLFSCTECVLVVSAARENPHWLDEVRALGYAMRAFHRPCVAIVVTKMDLVSSSVDVFDEVVRQTCSALLSVGGLTGFGWSPSVHATLPPVFRQRVLYLALCNRRMRQWRMPRDILHMVIQYLCSLDVTTTPTIAFSKETQNFLFSTPFLPVLEQACRKQALARQDSKLAEQDVVISLRDLYRIAGIGQVGVGRVVSGCVKPGQELMMLGEPTVDPTTRWRVFSLEQHHKSMASTPAPSFVGMNLRAANPPRKGRGGVLVSNAGAKCATSFVAQVELTHPSAKLKVGRCLSLFAHCAKFTVKVEHVSDDQRTVTMVPLKPCFVLPYPSELSYIIAYEQRAPFLIGHVVEVKTQK